MRPPRETPLILVLWLGACIGYQPSPPLPSDDSTGAGSSTGGEGSGSDSPVADSTGATGDETGPPPMGYDDLSLWLCHPDKPSNEDECRSRDLDATEILPDGSTALVEHVVAASPPYDCFYIYPTVDIRLQPGQTEDFDDIEQELDPLLSQAARFTGQCRVFAPLYHQVTLGTFVSPEADELLDAAYQDVAAAFTSYLEHHHQDRPLVIMGHSQGTFMTTRLLQEVVEPDPDLRARLVVALMIGGSVSVPEGDDRGGTFAALPLCTSAEQTGCVVAYRTYAEELPPEPGAQSADGPDRRVACTDPAALLGHDLLAGAYLPNFSFQPVVFPPIDFGMEIDTPFVLYRDFYATECAVDSDDNNYLALSVVTGPGDVRENPVDFTLPVLDPGFLGLHVFDYNFPLEDLLELVATKAAAMQ